MNPIGFYRNGKYFAGFALALGLAKMAHKLYSSRKEPAEGRAARLDIRPSSHTTPGEETISVDLHYEYKNLKGEEKPEVKQVTSEKQEVAEKK